MKVMCFDVVEWDEIPEHIIPNYILEEYKDCHYIPCILDDFTDLNFNEFHKFMTITLQIAKDQQFLIEC